MNFSEATRLLDEEQHYLRECLRTTKQLQSVLFSPVFVDPDTVYHSGDEVMTYWGHATFLLWEVQPGMWKLEGGGIMSSKGFMKI